MLCKLVQEEVVDNPTSMDLVTINQADKDSKLATHVLTNNILCNMFT